MALKQATATDTVIFLGASAPFPYDGGVYEGRPYAGGVSRRICVGTADGSDFYVMKLKTAAALEFGALLDSLGRGVMIDITYVNQAGRGFECFSVAPAAAAVGS